MYVAQLSDGWRKIPEIAAEAGVSEESIKRRFDAICLFLGKGIDPAEIVEWGQSRTISMANKEKGLKRGEGKVAKRFCLDVPEDLHELLSKQRARMGGLGICMAEYFNAHLEAMDDLELIHQAGLSK